MLSVLMVVLTWIYGQNQLVKFTSPLPWNDLREKGRCSHPHDVVVGEEKGHVSSLFKQ